MSITVAQLNKLADHFGFSVTDAREFLGLSTAGKKNSPSKSVGQEYLSSFVEVCSGGKCKMVMVEPKQKKPKTEKAKTEKPAGAKRGPTGYQLFMKDNVQKITKKLKSQHGEKLPRGAVLSAVGAEWKSLSDSKQASWKTKAAAM